MVTPVPGDAGRRAAPRLGLVASAKEYLAESYDPRRVEEQGWIGDEVVAGLGERGLLGLYVDPQYGGQGLTQTGYCRVSEEFGIDPTLSVVMGVHQSIGMKPIHLFGTDDQKARWLPDLAAGPEAGRLRPDRAERGLRRLPPRDPRGAAGRRLVGAQRREAVDRQRRPRRRGLLRPLRPRPRRAGAGEGHGGLRALRAARDDGALGQPPDAAALPGREGPEGEPPRGGRATGSPSPCTP